MGSQSSIGGLPASGRAFDDLLPTSSTSVHTARPSDLRRLLELATQSIPGVRVPHRRLRSLFDRDRDSIFAFRRAGDLIGGVAFLYLNCDGFDALMLDEINLCDPEPRFLAVPGEKPEAIYLWAIAGAGRSALGHVAKRFAEPRYSTVDIYTQPVTPQGKKLMTSMAFEPIPSWQPNLWHYRRQPIHTFAISQAA